jgi:hypothetical protein
MANDALFVGFGSPVRGRERQSAKVFEETMGFWGELQSRGDIDSFEAFFLEAHGGDLGGFFLLRGEREKLDRVKASDEFVRVWSRASLIVESFGFVSAYTGEKLGSMLADWLEQVDELT